MPAVHTLKTQIDRKAQYRKAHVSLLLEVRLLAWSRPLPEVHKTSFVPQQYVLLIKLFCETHKNCSED
jgi:hypothetical protein